MLMVGVARVGNDPVARYTPDGKPVMDISLAFDYGRKGNDGRRPTQWVNATMWGDRVERLQPYLSKGSQVFVTLSEPHIETYEKRRQRPGIFAAGAGHRAGVCGRPPRGIRRRVC